MLGAKYRIPKKEISNVVRRGKRFSSELYDLKVWYDDSLLHPKFAIVVSTKIDKRAVVRNTIKRKFRSAIYSILTSSSNQFTNANYAFIVKSSKITELSSDDLSELIRKIFTTH